MNMPQAFREEFQLAFISKDVDRIVELNQLWRSFLKGEFKIKE